MSRCVSGVVKAQFTGGGELWRTTLPAIDESMEVHLVCEISFSGAVLFNSRRDTDLQVWTVTPLMVPLRLGSCPTYLSHKRAVRLLSWGGFNALSGLTGMLNNIWEAYSTPSCVITLCTLRAISFA